MKKIITYLVLLIASLIFVWAQGVLGNLPIWLSEFQLAVNFMLISTLAGVLYCMRAIYVNYSVNDNWEEKWEVWYYLRPLASAVVGLVAFIFLKASIIAFRSISK